MGSELAPLQQSAGSRDGAVYKHQAQGLAFSPGTSEVVVTLWPSCVLFVHTYPDCSRRQLFLVPYSSFITCYSRRHLPRSSSPVKSSGPTLSHPYHKYVRLFQDNQHPPYKKIIAPYSIYITLMYRTNI